MDLPSIKQQLICRSMANEISRLAAISRGTAGANVQDCALVCEMSTVRRGV
jgi:hypothetical protein